MVDVTLDQEIQNEVTRLATDANSNGLQPDALQSDALRYINELKQSIYLRFKVKNTQALKQSGAFLCATEGMGKLDFREKTTWENLYRNFVGILPGEEHQQGYGCINGVDIFQYFKPWQILGLNPETATRNDIKQAYFKLSKRYHPDNLETGDRRIFERLDVMYKSILIGVK
jgi:hypothetical protein